MEKYTMFLDWKNQYCEMIILPKAETQCNLCQTTNHILYRIRIKHFTICMEIQKTLNRQSNLERVKQRNQAP